MIIIFLLLFILFRSSVAYNVLPNLCALAISDLAKDLRSDWFLKKATVFNMVFNPLHYNKWTTRQWYKYFVNRCDI